MTPTPSTRTERLAWLWPWLVGLAGALLFLWPLWKAPAGTLLERVFWYDALGNLDDLTALHESFSRGPEGAGLFDWLYRGRFFHPQPRALVVSELMPLAALATWPLAKWPLLAHNAAMLLGAWLSCVAGASFARSLGARPLAATVAGVGFSFCAYTNFSSGRVQLLFLFPVAFALAALVRWAREGRTRDAVLVAVWCAAQALLCLYYALFLALAIPPVALAARLAVRRPGVLKDGLVLGALLALVGGPALWLLWPYREMRTHLGLVRTYGQLVEQSGDPMMFGWADVSTVWGRLLPDRYQWDTAYFPGFVVALAALVALALWLRSAKASRWLLVPFALGVISLFFRGFPLFLLLGAGALAALVVLARRERLSPVAPVLATLVFVGFVLFLGPEPKAWGHALGWSPYQWAYFHVPAIDGIRVARRAGLLVQLGLCAAAALALTRLERRSSYGALAVGVFVLAALAEGMPLKLTARRVSTTCDDKILAEAHRQGAIAVGDVFPPKGPAHAQLAEARHTAETCGVATQLGPAGFVPPIAALADDAIASLPDPSAHAWLWRMGIRHLALRGGDVTWRRRMAEKLAGITQGRYEYRRDELLTLAPPAVESIDASQPLTGSVLKIDAITCDRGESCPALIDGDETTRWTSRKEIGGGEQLVLQLAPADVTGLEWHGLGLGTDLPRGLTVERQQEDGTWTPWAEFPAIVPLSLRRDAVHAQFTLPLPPARTQAIRLTQTGKAAHYWLSGSEIIVRGTAAIGAPSLAQP